MAARQALEGEGWREADENASSARSDSNSTSVNITTTNNFINVGQIVHVGGSNNTVILSGNQVQVVPQTDTRCEAERHTHSPPSHSNSSAHSHTPSSHHSCSPSTGSCTTATEALQVSRVTYAAGPPERMELLSLTQRLVGALGANWKILAAPLSISDCCRESIDHDERTLLLKVNKLLVTWVDTDERNDRNALATLLGSVAGFDLAQHCREALKKTV